MQLLRQLCNDNISHRYIHQEKRVIQQRMDQEIDVIQQMDFVPYFLINWDIVQHARKQGFFYVGRGSGANSILAYLLGITISPIELDLYFEPFINVYRKNPPDFDIDFSWRDRQAITDYIFKRFKNVALLGAYNAPFNIERHCVKWERYLDYPKMRSIGLLMGVYLIKA